MSRLFIFGFGSLLLLLVLIFLFVLLTDINHVKIAKILVKESQQQISNHVSTTPSWLLHVKKDKKNDFYYPATEVSIYLNLDQNLSKLYRNKSDHYRLLTQSLDEYQYFCLNQVLKQSNIKHKIERLNSSVKVMLYSKSLVNLKKIVKKLSIYNITSKIKKITK